MSTKLYLLFFFLFMVQPSWSLTLDWKGFSRTEGYYETSPEKAYYGNFHLVLKPEMQVVDGLSVFSRLDLYPFLFSEQSYSSNGRQTGVVFLNSVNSSKQNRESKLLFLNLSQVYLTYETEFFKFKLGKAPHHFGLGVTYSAETSPFDHWISTFNQLAFYFEYSSFYFQPSVFLTDKNLSSVNQIGMQGDKWLAEALLRYDLISSESFIEAFGSYKEGPVDTTLSVSYFFEEEDLLKLAVVFEGGIDLPFGPALRFDLKSGYVSKEFSLHPNYDVALLMGNRMTKSIAPSTLSIAEGRISDVAYISPHLSLSLLQDTFKITPIISFDYQLSTEKLNYEFDLQVQYNLEENLSILIQGGFLPSLEKNYFGLLAQAAVTF